MGLGAVPAVRSGAYIGAYYDSEFGYELEIVAPALNDYRYTALLILHNIELYPAFIKTPDDDDRVECEDESEYKEVLQGVLTSNALRKVITSLIAQSK